VTGGYSGNLVDYDNDGDLDLFHFCFPQSLLLNNIGNKKFEYVKDVEIVTTAVVPNGSATWGDYDNDVDQDVYMPTLTDKILFLNCGGITFERADFEPTNDASEADHETADAAFGDSDCDGDLDLYVNNFFNDDLNNYFYENNGNTNAWITLKLEGDNSFTGPNGKTSVSAEGAVVSAIMTDPISNPDVRCRQMRHVQTNEGMPHDVYFGFNDYAGTVDLEILWPSGLVQNITGLAVNQRYKILEATGVIDVGCPCSADLPTGNEISGTVGYDDNQDCDCDDNDDGIVDYPLDNIFVQIEEDLGAIYYAQTQTSGDYSMLVPNGNYTITPYLAGTAYEVSNDCSGVSPLPVDDYYVTVPPNSLDNDFCLKSNNCDVDLSIYPVYTNPASAPCPSIQQDYCMTVTNNGISSNNAVFTLDLDPNMVINTATSACGPVTIDPVNNTVTLNFPGVFGPGQTCTICATVTVDAGTLGTTLTTNGSVGGDCPETAQVTEFVSCAIDPNDKLLLSPESCGPDNNIQRDEMLTYRVRFQNEGNAPAVNVVIKDYLDTDLDLSTFQLLTSSHEVDQISILPGNKLILELNDIQLPAISIDSTGSQGFIMFGIKALPNVPEGTVVNNTAYIYFDLNEAVVTNTVTNTLREYPAPEVDFVAGQVLNTTQYEYNFIYTGDTPDGASYFWDFGPNATPQFSSDQNPSGIIFSTAGTEQVSLTLNRYGCETVDSSPVEITDISCGPKGKGVILCWTNPTNPGHQMQMCLPLVAAQNILQNNNNFSVGPCNSGCKSSDPGCNVPMESFESQKEIDDFIMHLLNGEGSLQRTSIHARAYPNPLTDQTTIEFKLSQESEVTISITDMKGTLMGEPFRGLAGAGETKKIGVDAQEFANGVYFYTIETDNKSLVGRLVVTH
ncbi:MAG: T9SS type A sorting domain-containing protein, partial [Crocinitomicaceae bacterium]